MTTVAHARGVGSMPLRRAPGPVARSTAAKAAFKASQSHEPPADGMCRFSASSRRRLHRRSWTQARRP